MDNPFPPATRVREDDDLSASAWNALAEAVDRARIAAVDGLDCEWSPEGVRLRLPRADVIFGCLTPSGGIGAATGSPPACPSAQCEIFALLNGQWTDLNFKGTVYNAFTSSASPAVGVGGGKYVVCYLGIDGNFYVLGEPC